MASIFLLKQKRFSSFQMDTEVGRCWALEMKTDSVPTVQDADTRT